jgi:DMSO/TMAO reductase YedYZ molybdopterin-dependent catalytic subunit
MSQFEGPKFPNHKPPEIAVAAGSNYEDVIAAVGFVAQVLGPQLGYPYNPTTPSSYNFNNAQEGY